MEIGMGTALDTDSLIDSIVNDCISLSDEDIGKATEIMQKRVIENDAAFRMLMKPLLREACYGRLRRYFVERRKVAWELQEKSGGKKSDRLKSLAFTLLDFPLPLPHLNFMPLREAKKDDLVATAQWYESHVADMNHKARWLRAIAQKVGTQKVGEKFTADQLEELQQVTK